MTRIQLILLVGEPKSSIAVEHLFRQVGQELLEDAPTINTHPARPPPIISKTAQKKKKEPRLRSLLLAELVDERNPDVALQVRLAEFIEPIFRDVPTPHSGVCARTKLVERAYVCPDIALIVADERSEDVDASFERYGEWDVVEHAEPRRQECDGSLRGGPRTWWRDKLLLLASVCNQSEKTFGEQ